MTEYTKPLPVIDDANRPYWEALKRHELRLPRCGACGHVRFQPYRYCPKCGSDEMHWQTLSGRGRIWAACVFHQVYFEGFRAEVPYNVVLVELEEGPRVYSNLVGVSSVRDVPIGTPVQAEFDDVTADVTLLKFRPAA
jgi:uncharacterized OB-fold protein